MYWYEHNMALHGGYLSLSLAIVNACENLDIDMGFIASNICDFT